MRWPVAALILVGTIACFGDGTPDRAPAIGSTAAQTASTTAPPASGTWKGFEASTFEIATLLGGPTVNKGITVEATQGFARDAQLVISVHSTMETVMISTPKLPAGGMLVACGVSDATCVELQSETSKAQHDLLARDAHTQLRIRGTWARPVAVGQLQIAYEATDDYFAVELQG